VPKSRVRKRTVYTAPPPKTARRKVSAPWVGPAIVVCLVVGLAWIVTYYLSQGSVPGMSALGAWNLVVGFAFIIAGVTLSTVWR
jgi:hypothetical protein